MIDTIKVNFFLKIKIVIFYKINMIKIKRNFKYTVSMFFSKIIEIAYF